MDAKDINPDVYLPGGIERSEARGQKDFVAAQTLPARCPRQQLEKLGFIFGSMEDDIFINVEFPQGWTKEATEHAMHNNLLDDKGRKRGSIFYKAASYDRSAFMSLRRRYNYSFNYDLDDGQVQGRVTDAVCDKEVFATDIETFEYRSDEYYEARDCAIEKARDWLKRNHPNYEDVKAYWEDV